MSPRRAHLFIAITRAASAHYKLPSGLSEVGGISECIVTGDEFCRLVEAVFAEPTELLYPWWAMYAAGMYEMIKDERYTWHWREKHKVEKFDAIQYSVDPPALWSGKEIGSPGI